MTFEDRVGALGPLGFSDRQTRFLVTVALHSGFCLMRQYAAFAGLGHGKNVRRFFDRLVARGLARTFHFERNRGAVYHLRSYALYRAIGQDDNRNRRTTGPALMARRLMLLDFVLSQPAREWFATEAEKVTFCRDRLGVAESLLPRHTFAPMQRNRPQTVRYFTDKLPIFLAGSPPVPHFAYLAAGAGAREFSRFLWAHAGLFSRLADWVVVAIAPRATGRLEACRTDFEAFCGGSLQMPLLDRGRELDWYFRTRRAVEEDNLREVPVTAIARFNRLRRRFNDPVIERLYDDWRVQGDAVLSGLQRTVPTAPPEGGRLVTVELPFTYRQFGALPGVA